MKKLYYVALTSVLVATPLFALADELPRPLPLQVPQKIREAASSTRAQMQVKVEQKREEMKTKIETKREEVKTKIEDAKEKAKERFGEAVQKSVGNITNRLSEGANRLSELADKIERRIAERVAKGENLDASTALLATARTDIVAAQDKVTAVGAALSAALTSTTPKAQVDSIRVAVKAAEDALRSAKLSLQKTLESMRPSAPTTPTN
ncbi:hypothetical protein EXS62_01665 [Candidatus Kaiserbacteria bacterium]|nr:hypothetical protein [Candidatus Kaiserbacteria bacterium]